MIKYESAYYGTVGLGEDHIAHYGVKGSKWGVRRYQNEDGSYTAAGAANGGRYAPKNTGSEPTSRQQKKLDKYRTKETAKLNKRYDKVVSKLNRKTEKLASKYTKAAQKGASDRKLNKIAEKYESVSTKKYNRTTSKAAEQNKINANSTNYKAMKRERRKVRGKAFRGYIGAGTVASGAFGLAWQGARRGKYKERTRISRSQRKQIQRSSAAQAAMDRAALQRKIKRR